MGPSSVPEFGSQKLGLALSGGGFRAAFFHLGVLAQLADRGLLRRVRVVSTVSGGSIVGALFQLHLKRLFERVPPDRVTDADYVNVVRRTEEDLLRGVQTNIRARVFSSYLANVEMHKLEYSRSDRVAELYGEALYAGVGGRKLAMAATAGDAHIKEALPELLINATSLNTGHNWRFGAREMGEAALSRTKAVFDRNARVKSHEYGDLAKQKDFPLEAAVAASAAVPLLFPPMAVSEDYEERIQLVDGGVHDNQGIQGLLDMGCAHVIVSDASQQMLDEEDPPTRPAGVLSRVLSIAQERLRVEQLVALKEKPGTTAVVLHLRNGVPARKVGLRRAKEGNAFVRHAKSLLARRPAGASRTVPVASGDEETSVAFGVDPEVQDLLSRMRTDLDAFSDVESFALAYDGYAMAEHELDRQGSAPPNKARDPASRWRFADVRPLMAPPQGERSPQQVRFLKQLRVSKHRGGKLFRLVPGRVWGLVALPFVVAGVAASFFVPPAWRWALLGAGIAAFLALGFARMDPDDRKRHAREIAEAWSWVPNAVRAASAAFLGIFGVIVSGVLRLLGRAYVRQGRLEKFGIQPSARPAIPELPAPQRAPPALTPEASAPRSGP